MKQFSWMAAWLVALAMGIAGCETETTPSAQPREGQLIPFQTEYHGQQGPFPDRGLLVVQRPEVWEALWGAQRVPTVDFSRQTALVALMGQQPTAGYDIAIDQVRETDEGTVVYLTHTRPAAGALVAQVISFPYHIVVVPKVKQPVYFVPVEGAPTPPIAILDAFVGVNSNATAPRTAVLRDELAWSRFWGESFGAAVAAPDIDFARMMAVAVQLGTRPTGGYTVAVTSVDRVDDRLVVNYRVRAPLAGQVVATAPTAPYAIAIVPASPLPVTFKEIAPVAPAAQ